MGGGAGRWKNILYLMPRLGESLAGPVRDPLRFDAESYVDSYHPLFELIRETAHQMQPGEVKIIP